MSIEEILDDFNYLSQAHTLENWLKYVKKRASPSDPNLKPQLYSEQEAINLWKATAPRHITKGWDKKFLKSITRARKFHRQQDLKRAGLNPHVHTKIQLKKMTKTGLIRLVIKLEKFIVSHAYEMYKAKLHKINTSAAIPAAIPPVFLLSIN